MIALATCCLCDEAIMEWEPSTILVEHQVQALAHESCAIEGDELDEEIGASGMNFRVD